MGTPQLELRQDLAFKTLVGMPRQLTIYFGKICLLQKQNKEEAIVK